MRNLWKDPNLDKKDIWKEFIFVIIISVGLFVYLLIWGITYSIFDAFAILGLAFFILVPSFITNGMMVLTGKIKGIKRFPIDQGKFFKDGERIFGDGKSWNGFIGGWIFGFLLSAAICWWFFLRIQEAELYSKYVFIDEVFIQNFVSSGLAPISYILSQLFIALGSPIGDLLGSFLKRRQKVKSGGVFLFFDQCDFIIVSSCIACIWFPYKWYFWIFVLLITPLLTALANWIGYLVGKKDVPW